MLAVEELLLAVKVACMEKVIRRGRERSERRALIVISSACTRPPRRQRHCCCIKPS